MPFLVGQRQFWRKPSVFATRSVSEGLYLTRSLAYASGYYFGKSGDVQLARYRVLAIVITERKALYHTHDLKSPFALHLREN